MLAQLKRTISHSMLIAGFAAMNSIAAEPTFVDPPYTPPVPEGERPTAANAYRILFVGNSITRHGTNDAIKETLKWDHVAGMAASSEDKDFAHQLGGMIQTAMPDRKVEIYFDDVNAVMKKNGTADPIQGKPFPAPHLVVIQTGEHETPGKTVKEHAEAYETGIIAPYANLSPRPSIVCAGIWSPSDKGPYAGLAKDIDTAYEMVCNKYQIPFVSVEKFATDPSCRGWGESSGVQWHPNDKGMEGYARLLFDAYQK